MSYVSLHTHSHFSILDGLSTEEEIAERTAELGQTAVALTDHGSLSGALKFQRECVARGVKPILGCEVYVSPGHRADKEARGVDGKSKNYHLILLAMNDVGWHNLVKLTTLANTEGYYYKPRVDKELLAEYSEGLICLSGCLGGELAQTILNLDGLAPAFGVADEYHDIFGDRYFLEVQNHHNPEDERVTDAVAQIARARSLPLVATGDSHYARIDDADLHDTLLCIQTLDRKDAVERKFKFHGDGFHLQSEEEMSAVLPQEAISNTGYIAAKCGDIHFAHTPHIPQVADAHMKLYQAVFANPLTAEEQARCVRELAVIGTHGFESYFLVVADICRWARAQGITVGPGRGSAGGSLVAYMLGITDVDPLRFGTIFERFMTAERMKMPDIDIDFSEREPVIKYIQSKYGLDNVSQVATFSKFGELSSTRDVGRALGLDVWHPDVAAAAKRLEGRVRGVSRHAAGVIISPEPIAYNVPLMRPVGATPGADKQTAWEYDDLEEVGYLKVDVLGVQRLRTIADAAKHIGCDIERSTESLDDINVFLMLSRGDVLGVFQLDSYGGKKTIKAMRPRCFEDIVAATSLDRPGPMESGALDLYMQRRHTNGGNFVSDDIPAIADILKDTYGVMVYQEQVMQIAQRVAGYTPGEADEFRAAMGKKKPEQMAAQRQKFIEGCIEHGGLDNDDAAALFGKIEYYAGYAFNRSHGIAYGIIAYRCAWLKYYHPVAWYTALLNERRDEQTKLQETIREIRMAGVPFLRADIYASSDKYVAEDDGIRIGLTGLADFGKVAYDELRRAVPLNSPFAFRNLVDLVRATRQNKLNSKAIGALIKAGALESMGDRKRLEAELPIAIETKQREQHEAFKARQHALGLTLAGQPRKRAS